MENRKIKYAIVDGYTMKEIVDKVNNLIPLGWRPLGGVAVRAGGYEKERLYQALIKAEE